MSPAVHRNAPLAPEGRRRLVERCRARPIAHVAAEMDVSRHRIKMGKLPTAEGLVRAVEGLDLEIGWGERVSLVGEPGSGKSATALSILGLARGASVEGEIWFKGVELLTAGRRQARSIRGMDIGLVLQDPLSSLNPAMTIGAQTTEPL